MSHSCQFAPAVRHLASALLILAGLLWCLPAAAQSAARPGDVSESEMASFAAAARRVHDLWRKTDMPVSGEVRKRMLEAVQAEGLDMETYNRIARGVRGNDTLYERYQQHWNQQQEE